MKETLKQKKVYLTLDYHAGSFENHEYIGTAVKCD
jgi:hypothetical protein